MAQADTSVALQSVENVEFAPGSLLTRITACHVTTYYHVGCAYMALSRWTDATRIFVTVLIYFLRMKQMHTRSYQYGSVSYDLKFIREFELTFHRSPSSVRGCTLWWLFVTH